MSLDPRDAFYGGRTGNKATHYEAENDEIIKYFDVCSLYPFVCKTGVFPIGHPEIFVGKQCLELVGINFENFCKNVEGIVKCEILPPKNLFHPILPFKVNNKLIFSLCRTCSQNLYQEECFHNSSERKLVGTWISLELKKAIQLGYTILKIEVNWQYQTTKYDAEIQSGGLFSEYVNTFF